MQLIDWDGSLVLGVKEMDEHHQKLVEILNRCYRALMLNDHSEELEGVVKELAAYTRYHFGAEERLMTQAGFARMPNHLVQHREFEAALDDLRDRFDSGESFVAMDVFTFLKDWLVRHIGGTDRVLADFLAGRT